ncbi:uncharacterized protein LOC116806058 isoform X2 [Drosophila grimshawi]|nr:uncharacterized protein LOC116806058 isoform X2 [Drosophila grimshawi]
MGNSLVLLMLLLAALGLLGASLVGKVVSESVEMPGERVLRMIPASARGSFLLYQLATAINSVDYPWLEVEQEQEQELLVAQEVDSSWLSAMANEFQHVPVHESFPMDFQTWLVDSYGINTLDVYQNWPRRRSGQAQSICNADGQCFEVAEIVAACCPF